MASLTETAYFARKGVNIGIILLILILILRGVVIWGVGLWAQFFPKPPPPPTLSFGVLPYPNGKNDIATPSGITYTLETTDGTLPTMPATVKVYFMPDPPPPSFDSLGNMKSQATKMGFTDSPKKLSETDYEFIDSNNPLRKLDINELSGNFHLVYDYQSDLSVFNGKNLTSKDGIVGLARGFFSSLGLTGDYASTDPTVTLLKVDNGNLTPVVSISNTDAAFVTLNRNSLDTLPVVNPNATRGLVSVFISGSPDPKKQILDAKYYYNPISTQNLATYPPISSQDALALLESGKAIYANLPNPLPKSIAIRDVSLAYLDPYPHQAYLQPVIVFSDLKGFIAYVPAISPKWLK